MDKKTTSIRFRIEYYEKLKRLSKNQDIAMSRYIENMLDDVEEK